MNIDKMLFNSGSKRKARHLKAAMERREIIASDPSYMKPLKGSHIMETKKERSKSRAALKKELRKECMYI